MRHTAVERPHSAVEVVYSQLAERILAGRLKPGDRLRQRQIADQFHVSIIPVREAFRRLESDGLVVAVHNRGAVVASISTEDFVHIAEIRLLLEVPAVRKAIPRLTPSDMARLRRIRTSMTQRGLSNSRWLELNREMRLTIVSAAGNRRLVDIIAGLIDASIRYRSLAIMARDHRENIRKIHFKLFDACEERDAEGAAALVGLALTLAIADVTTILHESDGRAPVPRKKARRPKT